MRIISGRLRGRRLRLPARAELRPTSDRARSALFSILGDRLVDASFLDLYAGSGAIGLEAWSRGASRVVAIERDRRLAATLEANARAFGVPADEYTVRAAEAQSFLARQIAPDFDVAFADPPWSEPHTAELADALPKVVFSGGLAVLEVEVGPSLAILETKGFTVRKYGQTAFGLLEVGAVGGIGSRPIGDWRERIRIAEDLDQPLADFEDYR